MVVPLRCAKSQRITSRCGYFARGHLHADSPIGCYRFDACCAKSCGAEKAGEVAGKALDAARPSLLRASRKAGELTRKAAKKISDDR
jgi:hypothetical protein